MTDSYKPNLSDDAAVNIVAGERARAIKNFRKRAEAGVCIAWGCTNPLATKYLCRPHQNAANASAAACHARRKAGLPLINDCGFIDVTKAKKEYVKRSALYYSRMRKKHGRTVCTTRTRKTRYHGGVVAPTLSIKKLQRDGQGRLLPYLPLESL